MFTKSKTVWFQFYTGIKESYTSHRLSNFFNFLTLKIILLQKWTLTELTKTFPAFMQPNSKATSEEFHNLLDFNGEELAKHPAPRMKNHPLLPVCWLINSIHLPLPSIPRGHLLHFQYEEILYHGEIWLNDLTAEKFLSWWGCKLLLSMIHFTWILPCFLG
jgi:hypothetical protein